MMERTEAAADESLAAILARIKLGIAIAAMIRMIATTISSSINEKPLCFCIGLLSPLNRNSDPSSNTARSVGMQAVGQTRGNGVTGRRGCSFNEIRANSQKKAGRRGEDADKIRQLSGVVVTSRSIRKRDEVRNREKV